MATRSAQHYANQLTSVQSYLAQGNVRSALRRRCAAIRNHAESAVGKKISAALAARVQRNAISIGQQIGCTASRADAAPSVDRKPPGHTQPHGPKR